MAGRESRGGWVRRGIGLGKTQRSDVLSRSMVRIARPDQREKETWRQRGVAQKGRRCGMWDGGVCT